MASANDQFEVKGDLKTRVSRSGRVCKKSSKMMYFDSTNGDIKKTKSNKASQLSSSSKKKKSNNIENIDVHNQTHPAKVEQTSNKSQKKNAKNLSKDSANLSSIEEMETESPDVIMQLNDPSTSPTIEKQSVKEAKESSQGNVSSNSDSETYSALSNNEIETPDYTSYDEESVNSDEDFLLSKKVTPMAGHEKLQPTNTLTNNKRSVIPQPIIYTGYKVWSGEMKKEILRKYPAIDLNVLNVRLGEMWNRLSTMERNKWYTRALVLAQNNKSQHESVMDYNTKAWLSSCNSDSVQFGHPLNDAKLRSIELEAIDVAAYLRLLGESLTLIGAHQLQQRKKLVKTSDCITVLLDSLLCAMGSLVCLTQQLPLIKTENTASLKQTLENIAYIMPGL